MTSSTVTLPETTAPTAEETLAFQWEDLKFIIINLGDWLSANAPTQTEMIDELVAIYGLIGGTTEQYLSSNARVNELLTEARLIQENQVYTAFRAKLRQAADPS